MICPRLSADDTQIADIQYDEKTKTIGFESLCPTVNRIFYDYRLPHSVPVRLSVTPSRTADDKRFYIIQPPRL